jgi:hypothetical protein
MVVNRTGIVGAVNVVLLELEVVAKTCENRGTGTHAVSKFGHRTRTCVTCQCA